MSFDPQNVRFDSKNVCFKIDVVGPEPQNIRFEIDFVGPDPQNRCFETYLVVGNPKMLAFGSQEHGLGLTAKP